MTYFRAPNGIEYKSKLQYFRSLEDQGTRSNTTFLVQMQKRHIPGYKERNEKIIRELWKEKYHYYTRKRIRLNSSK